MSPLTVSAFSLLQHITPNTPDLSELLRGRVPPDSIREKVGEYGIGKAKKIVGEVDVLSDVVVKFVLEEAALDWMAPKARAKLPESSVAGEQ